jgi:hypothetical protein
MENKVKKVSEMMLAIMANVHEGNATAMGVANELGVAPLDLEEWLEEFDEIYYEIYPEEI